MSEEVKVPEAETNDNDNKAVNNVKEEDVLEKVFSMWEKIQLCCYFIPIVTSLAFLIGSVFDLPRGVEDYILVPICIIGWIAALLTGPIRLIKVVFKCILVGWNIGFAVPFFPICFLTGAFCALLGMAVGLYGVMFAPAIFTIYYFFTDVA